MRNSNFEMWLKQILSINEYLSLMVAVSSLQWSHGPEQTATARHYLYLVDVIETEGGERQKEFERIGDLNKQVPFINSTNRNCDNTWKHIWTTSNRRYQESNETLITKIINNNEQKRTK